MNNLRLIKDLKCQQPYKAMAIEEAISLAVARGLAPDTFRVWRESKSVVIGRYQCPIVEIDFNSCLKYEVAVVRRFTGGGAVYHDCGNLNLAMAINRNKRKEIKEPLELLEQILNAVASCLEGLGLNVTLEDRSIEVNNKKIFGIAGKLTKNLVFAHGCLLVDSNLELLYKVLRMKGERKRAFVPSMVKEVTTVKREIGRKIRISEVVSLLIKAIEKEFDVSCYNGWLEKEEYDLAKELYRRKYSRRWWLLSTCKCCPEYFSDEPLLRLLMLNS